ncbi:MAG: hypothetical protein BWZ02_00049 [Lentisphaerae bacterium ADurb.BinA184]|nr:MAG: hypothetical protein BWZ02_00049 [Lentisphaerae bacterium ADurb.BinA184]
MWLYIVIALAGVGAVLGLIKMKQGVEWGKPLTVACALVALVLAIGSMFRGGGPSQREINDIRKRELAYERISTKKLGTYLAEKFSGGKALVIKSVEFMPQQAVDPRFEAQMAGLKEGLGEAVEIGAVVSPEIPEEYKKYMESMPKGPEGEDMGYAMMGPMMDTMLQAKDFNKLIKEMPEGTNLIISLIGLPMDLNNLSLWTMKNAPKLVLVSAMNLPQLQEAIREGYVTAMLTYRPDPDMQDPSIPKDPEAAFNKRYLLVTPENVQELAGQYPMLFPQMQPPPEQPSNNE